MDSHNVCGVFTFFLIKHIYLHMPKIVNLYVLVHTYPTLKILLESVLWKTSIFLRVAFLYRDQVLIQLCRAMNMVALTKGKSNMYIIKVAQIQSQLLIK